MNSNISNAQVLSERPVLKSLYMDISKALEDVDDVTGLFDFPLYQHDDGSMVKADAIVIAPEIGIWVISAFESPEQVRPKTAQREQVFSFLFSKLIKNPQLRRKKTELLIHVTEIVYDPAQLFDGELDDCAVCRNVEDLAGAKVDAIPAEQPIVLDGARDHRWLKSNH